MFWMTSRSNTVPIFDNNDFGFGEFYTLLNNKLKSDVIDMKMNIKEKTNEYIIEALCPGIDKKDIEITATEKNIKISYSKEKSKESENFSRKEFEIENQERVMNFSKDIDIDKITTSYINGLLTINIPKKDTNSKRISV